MSTWRDRLRPHIARVIASARADGCDLKETRKRLRAEWDRLLLGERKHHPYKAWCDEVKHQLGLVTPKPADPRQRGLFG